MSVGYYDEDRDEVVDDDGYCECGASTTEEEYASGRCDACGGWVVEDDDEDEFGDCGDPYCVMPGLHFRSECHTPDMVDAMNDDRTADQTREELCKHGVKATSPCAWCERDAGPF